MYGKIFESMYDGTISSNWKALITFQQMIVLSDSQGVIDIHPPALSKRTGIPLDIIEDGIEYLEQPDKYSRSQDHEGRRILRLNEHRPWGWSIVNHQHYRDLSSTEDRREKDRLRKQKQRSAAKCPTEDDEAKQELTGDQEDCPTLSAKSRHTIASVSVSVSLEFFNIFYECHPKKKARKVAWDSWQKLIPGLHDSLESLYQTIIDDVKHKAANDTDWLRGFAPYPATYLNQERWTDEVTLENRHDNNRANNRKQSTGERAAEIFAKKSEPAELTINH